MKQLLNVQRAPGPHWVGNGFPVRSLFSYQNLGAAVSPFLLLDYAGPAEFSPSEERRGVDVHPHRGFETVTIVFQGELEHRDSAGNHGKIGPGDVQWMTAASGIVHEEWHEQAFTKRGGVLEMVQLWVNLPAKFKMSPPKYQEILSRSIPTVTLEGGGTARVIAGDLAGAKGPAQTFTPLVVSDMRLPAGVTSRIAVAEGFTTLVVCLKGRALLNGDRTAGAAELAVFDRAGDHMTVQALEDATLLLLAGEPIDEPIAGYGPFVMNTQEEIEEAVREYQSGHLGRVSA